MSRPETANDGLSHSSRPRRLSAKPLHQHAACPQGGDSNVTGVLGKCCGLSVHSLPGEDLPSWSLGPDRALPVGVQLRNLFGVSEKGHTWGVQPTKVSSFRTCGFEEKRKQNDPAQRQRGIWGSSWPASCPCLLSPLSTTLAAPASTNCSSLGTHSRSSSKRALVGADCHLWETVVVEPPLSWPAHAWQPLGQICYHRLIGLAKGTGHGSPRQQNISDNGRGAQSIWGSSPVLSELAGRSPWFGMLQRLHQE